MEVFLSTCPNGLGGSALFGTLSTVFTACWNRSNASGPSLISGCGLGRFVSM